MIEPRKPRRSSTFTVKPYNAPEELVKAGNPGPLLQWCLRKSYNSVVECGDVFRERFGIALQTLYKWQKDGVPSDRLAEFESFVQDKKVRFILPNNADIGMFMRPARGRYEAPQGRSNEHLLTLLFGTAERQGMHTLELLSSSMRAVKSPHLYFRWGYLDGGVPVTYIEDFLEKLLLHKVHLSLPDKRLHDPERFSAFVRARLCVNPDYATSFYLTDGKN